MTKQVVAALILRGDEILCCQRTEHQALALKTTADVTTVDGGNIAAAMR